jgi:hypothetical protein
MVPKNVAHHHAVSKVSGEGDNSMDPAYFLVVFLEESVSESDSFPDLARRRYGEVGAGPSRVFTSHFGRPNWGLHCLFGTFGCIAHCPDFFVVSSEYDDGLEAFCERSIELILDDVPFVVIVYEESRGQIFVVVGVGHNS